VQNKPNLVRLRRIQNPAFGKDLRKKRQIFARKSKPKQTQTKPIRPPFFARYGTPNPKQTQTNPISPKTPRINSTSVSTKGYGEKNALHPLGAPTGKSATPKARLRPSARNGRAAHL